MDYIIEIKITKNFVDVLIVFGAIAFLNFLYFILPGLIIGNFRPRSLAYVHKKKLKHVRDIYGDEIIQRGARSEWIDKKGNTFLCTSLGYPSTIVATAHNESSFENYYAIQWTRVNAGHLHDFFEKYAANSNGNTTLSKEPFWIYGDTIELYLGHMKEKQEAQHVPIGYYLIYANYHSGHTIVSSPEDFAKDFQNVKYD